MANSSHSKKELRRYWRKFVAAGYNVMELARREGDPKATWESRVRAAIDRLGKKIPPGPRQRKRRHDTPTLAEMRHWWGVYEAHAFVKAAAARALGMSPKRLSEHLPRMREELKVREPERTGLRGDQLMSLLRRPGGATIADVAAILECSQKEALERIREVGSRGYNLHQRGASYTVDPVPPPPIARDDRFTYASDRQGYYRFGFITDNHYGSKYCREDVNEALYDWFEREGVTRVFNAGNWIDGEFPKNRHDLLVHGMQPQLDYFVERYPRRPGIVTDFVAGDDHEGWYAQREGVNIGQMAEDTARRAGRADLRYLGYMEAFIDLQRAGTRASTKLLVCHPGGGTAYAITYSPQKFVESLQGGEKPAVILFGHWHKIFDVIIRNVIALGGGCTKDLDPFGRKHVKGGYSLGGLIVELWQDERGAIIRYRTDKKQFFDRGYHNDQWSHSGVPSRMAA